MMVRLCQIRDNYRLFGSIANEEQEIQQIFAFVGRLGSWNATALEVKLTNLESQACDSMLK
jgi:hypothetical protein